MACFPGRRTSLLSLQAMSPSSKQYLWVLLFITLALGEFPPSISASCATGLAVRALLLLLSLPSHVVRGAGAHIYLIYVLRALHCFGTAVSWVSGKTFTPWDSSTFVLAACCSSRFCSISCLNALSNKRHTPLRACG